MAQMPAALPDNAQPTPDRESHHALFRVRPGKPADVAYLRSTWLDSDKGSLAARDTGPGYMGQKKREIAGILQRPNTACLVTCNADDDDAIVAFAVTGPQRVYYVYVRSDARGLGLARAMLARLLDGGPCEYTHRPQTSRPMPPGWTYNRSANHPRHDHP